MDKSPAHGKITRHKDLYFRSKTEALWASIFEALDAAFDYEPETFSLSDGRLYVPDFFLRDLQVWVEVKADLPTEREIFKISQLCLKTLMPCFIFAGRPKAQIFADGLRLTGFEISSALPPEGDWAVHRPDKGDDTSGTMLYEILSSLPSLSVVSNSRAFENKLIRLLLEAADNFARPAGEIFLEEVVRHSPWFRLNDTSSTS
jgi:hypothetical protein